MEKVILYRKASREKTAEKKVTSTKEAQVQYFRKMKDKIKVIQ